MQSITMDVVTVLSGLDDTYFQIIPRDVLVYCLAPYLEFTPGVESRTVGQVIANNVKGTHESVEAITHDDNIVVISSRVCADDSYYRQINMRTGKRLTLPGSTSDRHHSIHTITCGAGWYSLSLDRQMFMYTYASAKPTLLNPVQIYHCEEDDKPNLTRIHVWGSKWIELPGKFIASSVIDRVRSRIFTRRDESYMVHVVNATTGQVDFSVELPDFSRCSETSVAKCGGYWIVMGVNTSSETQNIDIYDAHARKVCEVSVPASRGARKLMAHPTGQKFAIAVPTDNGYQLLITMYEIVANVAAGMFGPIMPQLTP